MAKDHKTLPLVKVAPLAIERVAPFDGEKPYLATGDLLEGEVSSVLNVTYENKPSRADIQAQQGDVIYARMANTQKVLVVNAKNSHWIFSTGFAVHRPKIELVDPKFLYYYLLSSYFQTEKDKLCKGATQKAIDNSGIEQLSFPWIPLPEQKDFVIKFEKVDRLRQLRQKAQEIQSTFLLDIFLNMFGDPVRNNKGWERATIADLGNVQTGNTPSREEPENFGDFIEWIKSDNIRDEQLYVSPSREKLSEIGLKKGRSIDAGAVLITCIAGSLEHIGDTSLTDRTVAFNQQINAISPFDDVNPFFLRTMMHVAKPYIQYNASDGMKHIITKSKLEELALVKPPLSLQEEFAGVVARVESLRGRMSEAGRQVEGLFESLLAESFGGDVS